MIWYNHNSFIEIKKKLTLESAFNHLRFTSSVSTTYQSIKLSIFDKLMMLQCGITTRTPVQSVDTLTNATFTVAMPAWRHVCMLQSTHAHWARKVIRQWCHLSTAKYSSHLAIQLPENVLYSSLLGRGHPQLTLWNLAARERVRGLVLGTWLSGLIPFMKWLQSISNSIHKPMGCHHYLLNMNMRINGSDCATPYYTHCRQFLTEIRILTKWQLQTTKKLRTRILNPDSLSSIVV